MRLITVAVLILLLGWFAWGLYASAQQISLNKQLAAAVDNSNVSAVRRLLTVGADPNTREGSDPPPNWRERLAALVGRASAHRRFLGTPVLSVAAESHEKGSDTQSDAGIEIVKMLVSKGADVDAYNDPHMTDASQIFSGAPLQDNTALLGAAMRSHNSTARILLNAGADANAPDGYGDTALHYAVQTGNIELVQMLLEKKADINVHDDNGNTPLISAVRDGHPETVRFLMTHGADLNARNKNNRTLLMEAAVSAEPENVQILLRHRPDINAHDSEGSTALMLASWNNDPEATRLLIAAGADRNARDHKGHTALWYATGQSRERTLLIQSSVVQEQARRCPKPA